VLRCLGRTRQCCRSTFRVGAAPGGILSAAWRVVPGSPGSSATSSRPRFCALPLALGVGFGLCRARLRRRPSRDPRVTPCGSPRPVEGPGYEARPRWSWPRLARASSSSRSSPGVRQASALEAVLPCPPGWRPGLAGPPASLLPYLGVRACQPPPAATRRPNGGAGLGGTFLLATLILVRWLLLRGRAAQRARAANLSFRRATDQRDAAASWSPAPVGNGARGADGSPTSARRQVWASESAEEARGLWALRREPQQLPRSTAPSERTRRRPIRTTRTSGDGPVPVSMGGAAWELGGPGDAIHRGRPGCDRPPQPGARVGGRASGNFAVFPDGPRRRPQTRDPPRLRGGAPASSRGGRSPPTILDLDVSRQQSIEGPTGVRGGRFMALFSLGAGGGAGRRGGAGPSASASVLTDVVQASRSLYPGRRIRGAGSP
jgi:hypothetical protein